jgi:hypothetical protein
VGEDLVDHGGVGEEGEDDPAEAGSPRPSSTQPITTWTPQESHLNREKLAADRIEAGPGQTSAFRRIRLE